MIATPSSTTPVIDSSAFLAHWQGHRRLTRRVIAAFPEAELFTLSIGGMRPFATMALELIDMASAGVRGIATSNWPTLADHNKATASTRADLLAKWDAATAQIDETWPLIPAARFAERDTAFGMYPGLCSEFLLYFVDNEIHHRGQGYVYLRSLGITPPGFYERE